MRDSNQGQTVCGTSGSNLGENELGGLFRSVTSSMPGKFHFNLLVFGCPVGGGGGGQFSEAAVVLQISLLSVFFGIVWRFRVLTWEGSLSM